MSLDSSFWIDAPGTTPAQVKSLLLKTAYFQPLDDVRDNKRVCSEGCIVAISARRSIRDDLREIEIKPNLHLFFGCSDSEKTKHWTLNTVRAVAALLHAFPGNAYFAYSGDSPALLRRNGKTILDRRCGVWMPEVEPNVLPLIDLPYEWGIIPVT
jgi:hypothetical protein